jgi:molybdopterin molybdotransferase
MRYLRLSSYEEARDEIARLVRMPEEHEHVPVDQALDRIVARDVPAPIPLPHYPKSQMDGYAVKVGDVADASEATPVTLSLIGHVDAGTVSEFEVTSGTCAYVATGAALPEGADAVVMLEDAQLEGDTVTVRRSVAPGQHIMAPGYDIAKGALVIGRHERITPRAIGVLSALGVTDVEVVRPLRVAVISTGDEVVSPGTELGPASTYDANAAYLRARLAQMGCEVTFLGIARDAEASIGAKLDEARGCDIVLLSAGVSKGRRDHVVSALSQRGDIRIHGVAIKPGKPTLVGTLGDTVVIGLPGHPTSCAVIFTMLVAPAIAAVTGRGVQRRPKPFKVTTRVTATRGRLQFLPVRIEKGSVRPVFRGSGALSSFLAADGIALIPSSVEYLDEGDEVLVYEVDD